MIVIKPATVFVTPCNRNYHHQCQQTPGSLMAHIDSYASENMHGHWTLIIV